MTAPSPRWMPLGAQALAHLRGCLTASDHFSSASRDNRCDAAGKWRLAFASSSSLTYLLVALLLSPRAPRWFSMPALWRWAVSVAYNCCGAAAPSMPT